MSVSQLVDDLKQHLEAGAEFVASHIPTLVEWASKAEADPLVGAALATTLGPTGKQLVVDLIGRLEALAQEAEAAKAQAASDAAAAATAAAAAPPEPPADPAADAPAA